MKRCAETWRQPLMDRLPNIELVLAVGLYAVRWHLGSARGSLSEIVRANAGLDELVLPLPHPSPRNNIWLSQNRWFEREVLPVLRDRVGKVIGE